MGYGSTKMQPENGWLEDYIVSFWGPLAGRCSVSFRECKYLLFYSYTSQELFTFYLDSRMVWFPVSDINKNSHWLNFQAATSEKLSIMLKNPIVSNSHLNRKSAGRCLPCSNSMYSCGTIPHRENGGTLGMVHLT